MQHLCLSDTCLSPEVLSICGVQVHNTPGVLDECAQQVLQMLEGQLFGTVAEEKEVAAVTGGVREAKKARSFDTYALLAQTTTLSTHLTVLLGLVGALDIRKGVFVLENAHQ